MIDPKLKGVNDEYRGAAHFKISSIQLLMVSQLLYISMYIMIHKFISNELP